MAVKTNGKLVSTTVRGSKVSRSTGMGTILPNNIRAAFADRIELPKSGKATNKPIQAIRIYAIGSQTPNAAQLGLLQTTVQRGPLPGRISLRRYGYRRINVASMPPSTALQGRLITGKELDDALNRKYKFVQHIMSASRVAPIIGTWQASKEVAQRPQKVFIGISTFGFGYSPPDVSPPDDCKPVRKWPRDWHGDNMH